MAKRSYRDLIGISEKWLGLYLELYSESRGSVWNFVDCGIIIYKDMGLFVIVAGIFWFWIYFPKENCMD
jgi:hypothetical protein